MVLTGTLKIITIVFFGVSLNTCMAVPNTVVHEKDFIPPAAIVPLLYFFTAGVTLFYFILTGI
jgi:hypothetical protein